MVKLAPPYPEKVIEPSVEAGVLASDAATRYSCGPALVFHQLLQLPPASGGNLNRLGCGNTCIENYITNKLEYSRTAAETVFPFQQRYDFTSDDIQPIQKHQ